MDRPAIRLHYRNMAGIPIYGLYGEAGSTQDWLHWESIQARSRLHGYRIAPHRHEHFVQVLALETGSGTVTLDGTETHLTPVSIVVIPPLTVHGYSFSQDVDGLVITLMEHDVRGADLAIPAAGVLTSSLAPIRSAMDALIAEAGNDGPGHDSAMAALITLLAVSLQRATRSPPPEGAPDRAMQLAIRFRALVETQYRQTRRLADYADKIGVSQTHLNRISRSVLGSSALAVIERRVAIEARRMLLFSTLSIKQIGAELGYEDPAYFSRVITRVLGAPPGALRRPDANAAPQPGPAPPPSAVSQAVPRQPLPAS